MKNALIAHVSPEEIAYAAALFMAAADRQLYGRHRLSRMQEVRCQEIYEEMTLWHPEVPCWKPQPRTEASLYAVFHQLWANYRDDRGQEPICSRILAFHLLAERTRGDVIQGWTRPVDGKDAELTLHPAVVRAIASARLCEGKGFIEQDFEAEILLHAQLSGLSRVSA